MVTALARNSAANLLAGVTIAISMLLAQPAFAQGPGSVADLAESLLGSVVNISTSQKVEQKRPNLPIPKVPEGSPFQDFFDELFPDGEGRSSPRTVQSQGSGFVIDESGNRTQVLA